MTSVETRKIIALWYAWGQLDAGRYPDVDILDGFTFAAQQEAAARAFYEDEATFYLANMIDGWHAFATALSLERQGVSA
jgi:hypothetical protein